MRGRLRVAPGGNSRAAGVCTCSAIHGRATSLPAGGRGTHSSLGQAASQFGAAGALLLTATSRSGCRLSPGRVALAAALRCAQSKPCQPAEGGRHVRQYGLAWQTMGPAPCCPCGPAAAAAAGSPRPPLSHLQKPPTHSPRPLHWLKQNCSSGASRGAMHDRRMIMQTPSSTGAGQWGSAPTLSQREAAPAPAHVARHSSGLPSLHIRQQCQQGTEPSLPSTAWHRWQCRSSSPPQANKPCRQRQAGSQPRPSRRPPSR